MKIYVYAICKNEEKFVTRWINSMRAADGVFVLDTGSTDNTVKELEKAGAVVNRREIIPWRFDEARNISLSLVPDDADLCVCTDIDEIFKSGWRQNLENSVKTGQNLFYYKYVWSHGDDGSEGVTFNIAKIHARHGFKWVGAVHETIEALPETTVVEGFASDVVLEHFPDKTKSRAQYLPLLEQAVKEQPENDRNTHYLGREYMFYERYNDAIATLKRHLALPSATWKEERCASMRYIGRCYSALGEGQSASKWLLRAVAEYPFSREPFVELGLHFYSIADYDGAIWAMKKALEITAPSTSYINEPRCFSALPYDLLSIALYKGGRSSDALIYAEKALALSPNDQRIRGNVAFFRNHIKE